MIIIFRFKEKMRYLLFILIQFHDTVFNKLQSKIDNVKYVFLTFLNTTSYKNYVK